MDKWIDQLLETSWFLKVVAFILAFFLFLNVYDSNNNTSIINVATRTDTAVIEDVPVTAYYDTDNLVITGLPKTVDVKLTGPINLLQVAKIQKDFEVYINLQEVQIGTSTVPIQIRDVSDKLKVELSQSNAKIDVQEKITQEYSVTVEYNPAMIEAGYEVEESTVTPGKVSITGAKNVIEQIAYVKATLDLAPALKETVEEDAEIVALDAKMSKLDVSIEPSEVHVVLPIKQLSKQVPLEIVEENKLPENIAIQSIELTQDVVNIFGSKEALESTNSVQVTLDLSKVNQTGTYTLPIVPVNGITTFNPTTIQARIETVQVEQETEQEDAPANSVAMENRIFTNIPIRIKNLDENYEAQYMETTSLNVSGPADIIYKLSANDFKLELDATNLKEGKHEAAIIVSGPSNVTWELDQKIVELTISPKENG